MKTTFSFLTSSFFFFWTNYSVLIDIFNSCRILENCWNFNIIKFSLTQSITVMFSRFLDVLAGRKDPSGVSGHLLLDGRPVPNNFKCMVGYVVQVIFIYQNSLHLVLFLCSYISVTGPVATIPIATTPDTFILL